ncbi:LOW QUALITY PROTEIN: PAX3- and PAX7-binding protein 1 [Aphomia sociella]
MSLFRKPKKIQRRVFCADDDDEEPEPPPPPVISYEKKEKKPIKSVLLSFADEEEEDGEVFKVKKSSQSKRLTKRREKEKRRAPDGDNNKYDNNDTEDKPNNADIEDKPKQKKKVTLEGLILSGREALAADGAGDVSDGSVPDEEEEDSRGFHQYRADTVRAALAVAPGHIPDAALIHAARKTRQQARELGDFVPLQKEAAPGSRLVRDDGSGDEEEEGRIHVRGLELPSDKPKRGTAAAASDEELDSEAEEWVEQQMQKAMPAIVDITGEGVGMELNPFAAPPPPPPSLHQAAHLRPLAAAGQQPANAEDLVHALEHRLEELQMERGKTSARREEVWSRLAAAAKARETRGARAGPLAAAYRRAQAARGYLTDLIECLDEKIPQLEALEARALAMHRRRCEFLVERRRADLRDQAQDVLAKPARPGAAKPADSEEKIRRAAEREGRRRARRLQRAAAAAAAGAAHKHRDGDSSDDELPPAELQHHAQERESIRQLSSSLFADALPAWRGVRGVCARLARFRRRSRALYCDAYVAHYLPQLLAPYVRHQLILWNPLADEDNEDYEKMDWYKCLMMYGVRSERLSSESDLSDEEDEEESRRNAEEGGVTESSVREDPDLYLVPTIINKLVLPKLTELVEHAWDPMCVRACVRLRTLLLRAACLPAGPAAAPGPPATSGGPGAPPAPLRRLATAVRVRLAAALNADVFLPTLPPQAMEGAGGGFWRRCAGAGARLQRGALALAGPPPLLHADPLVLALIETLCCAAGAAAGAGDAGARGGGRGGRAGGHAATQRPAALRSAAALGRAGATGAAAAALRQPYAPKSARAGQSRDSRSSSGGGMTEIRVSFQQLRPKYIGCISVDVHAHTPQNPHFVKFTWIVNKLP